MNFSNITWNYDKNLFVPKERLESHLNKLYTMIEMDKIGILAQRNSFFQKPTVTAKKKKSTSKSKRKNAKNTGKDLPALSRI